MYCINGKHEYHKQVLIAEILAKKKKNPEKKLEVINFAKIEEDAQFASGFVLHLPAVVSQYLTQCVIASLKQL